MEKSPDTILVHQLALLTFNTLSIVTKIVTRAFKKRINTRFLPLIKLSLYYTKNRQACTTILEILQKGNFLML